MKGILRRDGNYVARPTHAGKKFWLGTFATLEEAEAAIVKWRERGYVEAEGGVKIADIVKLYADQNFGRLQPATIENYRRAHRAFAAELGGREVRTLRKIEVQMWANTVPPDYLRAVRTLFEWARRMDVCRDNPTAGVHPRPSKPRRRAEILTIDQVRALAESAFEIHDEPYASILAAHVLFAAGTGMRPGEIAALRWHHVNFAADEIAVEGSITLGRVEKAPKNGDARKVVLTPLAREALTMLESALPDDRIFELPEGQILVKATQARYFDPMRRHVGLAGFYFYNLRHTCATWMLELGLPSYVVATQLGHQDGGRLVETTYGHPSAQRSLDQIKQATQVASPDKTLTLRVAGPVANGGSAA